MFSYPLRQILEVSERVSIAGDEFLLAVLGIRERTKAVDLQLEDELVGIERFIAAGKPHRAHLAGQHGWIIALLVVTGPSRNILQQGWTLRPIRLFGEFFSIETLGVGPGDPPW